MPRSAAVVGTGLLLLATVAITSPGATARATTATNMCSNPVLAQNLNGWGPMDGASVSRDTVGDLAGASWAFDTAGRQFYQPQFTVSPGQQWTVSARDRVLNASGTSQMSVDWYSSTGSYLSSSAGPLVSLPQSTISGGSWTLVSATFTVPAGATTAHVLQTGDFGSGTGTAFKATECDYEQVPAPVSSMPVGDLPPDSQGPQGWHQVFADDFTTSGSASTSGALPDGKWWGYDAGTHIVNSSNGVYDSSRTVSVANGLLTFNLHSESGTAYAAVESPLLSGSQTYGRYDVRYRYQPGSNIAGFKTVWMLWPDDDHWGEGEIDFNEYANQADRTNVSGFLHHACGNDSQGCAQDSGSYSLDPTQWHVATAIWSPGKVTAYVDGHLLATSTSQVPSTPMHLLLQTEASDYGPEAVPGAAMKVDVDWATLYTRK